MKNKQLALSMLVALAAGTTWYVATAQESRDRPVSQVPRSFSSPTPASGHPYYSTGVSEADTLRHELIELTAAAASMMDEEELAIEVERAGQRATVMAADQRLDEIREQLTELTETYPDTDASATASAMLAIEMRDASEVYLETGPIPNEEAAEGSEEAASFPNDKAAEGSVDIEVDDQR